MTPPDQRWLPYLKLCFGYLALLTLAALALTIALWKVEESTSYGLQYILGALTVLCGGWSQWAFGGTGGDDGTPVENVPSAADRA